MNQDKLGQALWEAAEKGEEQKAGTLLDSKANIHYQHQEWSGATPLHIASLYGNLEVVKVLLARKADPNIPNQSGYSALHCASANGHQSVVDTLLKSNANITLQDIDGDSPLHRASYYGKAAVVEVLLAHNADPTIKNKDGGTARDLAVEREPAVVKLLDDYQEMEKLRRQHQEELEILKRQSQESNHPSQSHTGKAVGEWNVEDSQAWVSSLGPALAKYSQLFAENGVDGETLLAFDKGDLTALGINAAHATMIIQKLKFRVQPSSPVPTSTSPLLPTIQDNVYEPVDTIMDTGDNLDLSKLVINKHIRLGAGNFGEVYQGSIGHQQVAVKMIKPAIAGVNGDKESKESKEAREKADKELEKEMKTWKKVPQHENVARLLGEVDRDGCKCIVMHLYPGGSLKEELDLGRTRGFSLKKKKSLSILLGIANGLKHLHQHQIVHRDLAARNILFENNARDIAVITDFGLSRDIGADRGEQGQGQGQGKEYYAMTGGGTLAIAWLPPETLIHRKSTVKSDVWSFGVLVWEVITQGLTPLSQLDPYQISGQAATGELRNTLLKALDKVEDADQDLVKLVEMCLIVDPVTRPSMVEVANAVNTLHHQTLQRQAHFN